MQKSRLLACLAFILLLSGCEVKLYTGLTEREGNDMLAILLDGGITARKELDKDIEPDALCGAGSGIPIHSDVAQQWLPQGSLFVRQ